MSKSKTVVIDRQIIQSNAFMKLTGVSPQVFLLFLARRKLAKVGSRAGKESWEITNNGEIVFPYSQAESKFGITKPRFRRAIKQLIEFGFIDINHHGGGLVKDCTTYFISDRWMKYGKENFVRKTLPKDTRKLGFTSENWEERSGKKRKSESKIANENVTSISKENVTCKGIVEVHAANENVTNVNTLKTNPIKGKGNFSVNASFSNENITILK